MRPRVKPGIPRLIPRIDVGQAEVAAASLDEERGDSHPALTFRAALSICSTVASGTL
jgi:hypothetical protein